MERLLWLLKPPPERLPNDWPPLGTPVSLRHYTGSAIECTQQPMQYPYPVFLKKSCAQFTLYWLYGLGEKNPWWWQLINRLQSRIPYLLIPRKTIFKLYTQENPEEASPSECGQAEEECYVNLQTEQGHWDTEILRLSSLELSIWY